MFSVQQVEHDGVCGRDDDDGAVLPATDEAALLQRQVDAGRQPRRTALRRLLQGEGDRSEREQLRTGTAQNTKSSDGSRTVQNNRTGKTDSSTSARRTHSHSHEYIHIRTHARRPIVRRRFFWRSHMDAKASGLA